MKILHRHPVHATVLTVILWLLIIAVTLTVSPESTFGIPLMLSIIFFAFWVPLSWIFRSAGRGILIAIGITGYFFLRMQELDSVLHIALVVLFLVTVELYFWQRNR